MMFSLVIVLLAVITVIGNASAQSISSSLGLAPYPSKGQNKAAQQQQAEQAKTETLQQFNKAFSACMEGRGYAVK